VPRVLIVDDDPVSLHFLASAMGGLDCNVVAVGAGAEALTAARWAAFDLLLLDRRLPDMNGAQLLAALRTAGVGAPAVATSAEVDREIDTQLRLAGFVDVLAKPLTLDTLRQRLQPLLASPDASALKLDDVLDNASARAAIGSDAEALRALRSLFAVELNEIEREWAHAQDTIDQERLHRLRASCGFCGAVALGAAAKRLEDALRSNSPDVRAAREEFLRLCALTRERLDSFGIQR